MVVERIFACGVDVVGEQSNSSTTSSSIPAAGSIEKKIGIFMLWLLLNKDNGISFGGYSIVG